MAESIFRKCSLLVCLIALTATAHQENRNPRLTPEELQAGIPVTSTGEAVAKEIQGAKSELSAVAAIASPWPDQCSKLPGFYAFRATLERVAKARDTAGLIALLHPRLLPKRPASVETSAKYQWVFGRYREESFWNDFQEALKLGCVQRGDKLLLPAMAELIHDTSTADDGDVALVDLVVRSKPEADASVIRSVKRGDRLRTFAYDNPPGWMTVIVGKKEGYVPMGKFRSPYDFQLELTKYGERWSIHEYGVGV